MAHTIGFYIGICLAVSICGFGSHKIWKSLVGDQHSIKRWSFVALNVLAAGLLGLIGGLPALLVSYLVARAHKAKPSDGMKAESFEKLAG